MHLFHLFYEVSQYSLKLHVRYIRYHTYFIILRGYNIHIRCHFILASIELINEWANCLWFVFMVFHFLVLIAWDKHLKMFISMTSCTKLSVCGFSHHI